MGKSFVSQVQGLAVLLAACSFCAGQSNQALTAAAAPAPDGAKTSTAVPGFSDRSPRYRIEPGDTFDLTFELSPEFNQTAVAVQPDGFVTLRSVGDVKVAGQTVPEVTQTLKQAYS
jgi:protein involved in polysaccharide export with SLBB domain